MMRTLRIAFGVLGTALLLTNPARAQEPASEDYATTVLFFNKGVQHELKLDAKQVDEAAKLAETFNAGMFDAFSATHGRVSGQKRRDAMRELMKPLNDTANKTISTILKPEQKKRYRQIVLQQRGVHVFMIPDLQRELKISDAQKDRLKAIIEETNDKTKEILQTVRDAGQEASLARYAGLRKEMIEKAIAELTDSQKKAWKEMVGEPFEYKFEPLS